MNTSRFVSGSSVLLAGWLGATFFNEVPAQRYPKLDKTTNTTALPALEDKSVAKTDAKPADQQPNAIRH